MFNQFLDGCKRLVGPTVVARAGKLGIIAHNLPYGWWWVISDHNCLQYSIWVYLLLWTWSLLFNHWLPYCLWVLEVLWIYGYHWKFKWRHDFPLQWGNNLSPNWISLDCYLSLLLNFQMNLHFHLWRWDFSFWCRSQSLFPVSSFILCDIFVGTYFSSFFYLYFFIYEFCYNFPWS